MAIKLQSRILNSLNFENWEEAIIKIFVFSQNVLWHFLFSKNRNKSESTLVDKYVHKISSRYIGNRKSFVVGMPQNATYMLFTRNSAFSNSQVLSGLGPF